MSADASELRRFATDLGKSGARVLKDAEKVVFKGAMNIKSGMQEEMRGSRHFKSLSRSIDFDIEARPNGVEAEIGPKSGSGEAGNLANIAYFGSSRGGGTVDFMKPFEDEKPRFEKAIGEVLKDVL